MAVPRASSEEIDVPRGAGLGAEPVAQEERTLEHEALALVGAPQPVQETLQGVQLQQFGEGPSSFASFCLEPIVNRVRQPGRARRAHCMASR